MVGAAVASRRARRIRFMGAITACDFFDRKNTQADQAAPGYEQGAYLRYRNK
jgi:hypothetical protein